MAEPRPETTGNATSTPLWLKAFGIIVLIAVVIAVVMLPGVLGMGGHGPGLHQPP
jgi:hypothetical protein